MQPNRFKATLKVTGSAIALTTPTRTPREQEQADLIKKLQCSDQQSHRRPLMRFLQTRPNYRSKSPMSLELHDQLAKIDREFKPLVARFFYEASYDNNNNALPPYKVFDRRMGTGSPLFTIGSVEMAEYLVKCLNEWVQG